MYRPCPICKKQSLTKIKLGHIFIDKCPKCKGIWLDGGELFEIVSLVRDFGDKYLDVFDDDDIVFSENQVRRLLCPKCRLDMRIQNAGKDKQTVIDRCTKCRGIWLDAGEIFELVQESLGS